MGKVRRIIVTLELKQFLRYFLSKFIKIYHFQILRIVTKLLKKCLYNSKTHPERLFETPVVGDVFSLGEPAVDGETDLFQGVV